MEQRAHAQSAVVLKFCHPPRADQEYQAPPFYQGELGYNPGFDGDDPDKAGLEGEEGLPGELRFVRKYKRQRRINILGTLVWICTHTDPARPQSHVSEGVALPPVKPAVICGCMF